jgi:hypothetical protein
MDSDPANFLRSDPDPVPKPDRIRNSDLERPDDRKKGLIRDFKFFLDALFIFNSNIGSPSGFAKSEKVTFSPGLRSTGTGRKSFGTKNCNCVNWKT